MKINKSDRSDIIVLQTFRKFFTDRQIEEIVSIIYLSNPGEEELEKLRKFFLTMLVQTNDLKHVVLEFMNFFDVDPGTFASILKNSGLNEVLKMEKEGHTHREFLNLFE